MSMVEETAVQAVRLTCTLHYTTVEVNMVEHLFTFSRTDLFVEYMVAYHILYLQNINNYQH